MNENDLARTLLSGEEPIDPRKLTERVLRRDRHRVWVLGFICIVAWMSVVMLPWATILPMMAKMVQYQLQINQNAASADQRQFLEMGRVMREGTIATFIGSVASMFFAAICTVSMIIISRRATLRQVNARLSEISAQLKTLAAGAK